MTFEAPLFYPIVPEMVVLVLACVALVSHLFFHQRFSAVAYFIVQGALLLAAGLTVAQLGTSAVVTFNGLFISDDLSRLLKLFIYIASFVSFYYSRLYIQERNIAQGEYYVLGLFSVLGMMVLVSAHSFMTIYLGLELLSLPLYAMVALRRDSATATEAAMKYFVMGAIASGMLLYGMSILYGVTGSLTLSVVADEVFDLLAGESTLLLSFALVFLLAGIGFKLAAAPFHMWAPDVYTGAPSSATLFLSTAPKIAAFGMALRLLVFALPDLFVKWQELVIVLAVFSIVLGNLLAIAQQNIKRMLAYSAIAHIGYMLLGLVAGTSFGYGAALFYILVYALMSLAAFGMVVLFSKAGFEAENISDFKGLNSRSPWLAFLVLVVMFSMAGIPPTVGFFAKLLVIKAVIDVSLTWLAVMAMLFAVVGAFYYLRIVKVVYFDQVEKPTAVLIPFNMQVLISLNGLVLLALGLFPGPLIQASQMAFG